MDSFTKSERSRIMRAVKSHGNKSTELRLIKILKENSIKGWRRKYKLFGNPDFVFPAKKAAIFTDGCFWHGHICKKQKPKDNKEYWEAKIKRNKKRDRDVTRILSEKGWRVLRIWECEMKNKRKLAIKIKTFFKS